jgi:hypothetical protein
MEMEPVEECVQKLREYRYGLSGDVVLKDWQNAQAVLFISYDNGGL